jgi:hypothetical protein
MAAGDAGWGHHRVACIGMVIVHICMLTFLSCKVIESQPRHDWQLKSTRVLSVMHENR